MFSNKDVIGKIICSKSIASKTLRALIIKVSPVIQNLTLSGLRFGSVLLLRYGKKPRHKHQFLMKQRSLLCRSDHLHTHFRY